MSLSFRASSSSLLVLACILLLASTLFAQASHPNPVLLVSIDGFRPDYLDRGITPNLSAIASEGVRADAMIASFPTKTFPNHYTIVTGLYPAHHGIVGNTMWDPVFKAKFSLGNHEETQNPRWWGGEPIWVTAEKQNCPAATMFWPGSDVKIAGIRPSHYKVYDKKFSASERIQTVLEWMSEPVAQQPCIATLYFEQVDDAGHEFGPYSEQVAKAIQNVDAKIGELVKGLKEKGLWEKVNLMIVSDHGMTLTPASQFIHIEDYIDLKDIDVVDWSPVFAVDAKSDQANAELVKKLNQIPHIRAYLAKDVPDRLHYSGSRRITPVVGIVDEGWTIMTRETEEKKRAKGWLLLGDHGYDNDLYSMRATFIARGPAFKAGTHLVPFPNVDVYPLLTDLLHLKPAANDGSEQVFLPVLNAH